MKCLHLNCELKPFPGSHWCLEHAWRFNRKDGSGIVPNDAQRVALKKFPEILHTNNVWCFPQDYVETRRRREQRVAPWGGMVNTCWDCNTPIISRVKYCGRCRTKLGIPNDETEPMIRCDNWGKSGPGRQLNSNCRHEFPARDVVLPPGSIFRYCRPCFIRLDGRGPEWRKREGFDF